MTAPEMGSLFSRCLARQCAEVLQVTGGEILELGAGSGRMAADVLTELAAIDTLPERYCHSRSERRSRRRQRRRIEELPRELAERVHSLDRWPERVMRGVVLANEVLDAMPVEQFVLRGRPEASTCGPECGLSGEGFEWRETSPSPELMHAVADIVEALPAPLPTATCRKRALLSALDGEPCGAARGGRGAAHRLRLAAWHLYHPDRSTGTLRCHFRHRAHSDPFINVGCRTSPRGWISRASPKPPTAQDSRCWGSPARRRS